ncbi:MAG: hypothetical protein KC646_05425 [Candidatus Cloacimonetes bacterium]|nr:hypothetical protein [Candidatus Cloacimonadota bacterium]
MKVFTFKSSIVLLVLWLLCFSLSYTENSKFETDLDKFIRIMGFDKSEGKLSTNYSLSNYYDFIDIKIGLLSHLTGDSEKLVNPIHLSYQVTNHDQNIHFTMSFNPSMELSSSTIPMTPNTGYGGFGYDCESDKHHTPPTIEPISPNKNVLLSMHFDGSIKNIKLYNSNTYELESSLSPNNVESNTILLFNIFGIEGSRRAVLKFFDQEYFLSEGDRFLHASGADHKVIQIDKDRIVTMNIPKNRRSIFYLGKSVSKD